MQAMNQVAYQIRFGMFHVVRWDPGPSGWMAHIGFAFGTVTMDSTSHEHMLIGPAPQAYAHGKAHKHTLMGRAQEHMLMGQAHVLMLLGLAHEHTFSGLAHKHMLLGQGP